MCTNWSDGQIELLKGEGGRNQISRRNLLWSYPFPPTLINGQVLVVLEKGEELDGIHGLDIQSKILFFKGFDIVCK